MDADALARRQPGTSLSGDLQTIGPEAYRLRAFYLTNQYGKSESYHSERIIALRGLVLV